MKAPSFAYVRPRSPAEMLASLEEHDEGARVLGSGQSLAATLSTRRIFVHRPC